MSQIPYLTSKTLRNRYLLTGTGYFIVGGATGYTGCYIGSRCIEANAYINVITGGNFDQSENMNKISMLTYPFVSVGLLGTIFCWHKSSVLFRIARRYNEIYMYYRT